MKRERPVDLAGDRLVAAALGARRDELLVPDVHLGEVGEAALGEGAQQVERRRGVVVGARPCARGPATRASASKASSFTMWPRKLSSSTPPISSGSADRGLANWPAIRPIFTTGTPVA